MAIYRKWFYFIPSVFIFIMTLAHAETSPDIATVQAAYYQWCNAINNAKGNAKVMVDFYAPDAILVPTLAADLLINREGGLNHYFSWLTSLHEIKCIPQKIVIHVYGDIAISSGFYKFTYQEKGKQYNLPARFTFVYKKFDNRWMIITHHSSKMPDQ